MPRAYPAATWLGRIRRPTVSLELVGLMAGFALRIYQLSAQSLWYDEGVTWYLTRMSLPQLTVWTANDIQPPLYYYLLWLWVRVAGSSEWALRFPSTVFGVVSLPLLWVMGRRLFGRPAAWLALLFGIVSPLHVYYAQEARMYTLLALLGLLSSYLLLRMLDYHDRAAPHAAGPCSPLSPGTPAGDHGHGASAPPSLLSRRHLCLAIAYVVAAAAMLYTHYFALFLLAAHVVYAAYHVMLNRPLAPSPPGEDTRTLPLPSQRSPKWQGRGGTERGTWDRALLLIPVAILILYMPWLPQMVGRFSLDSSYWSGALKLDEVARKLFITFAVGETVKEAVGLRLAAGYAVVLAVCLAALAYMRCLKRQATSGGGGDHRTAHVACRMKFRAGASPLIFCLTYLAVPLALTLLLAYCTPKFNPRYAMPAWPAFVLLLAGGLSLPLDWAAEVRRRWAARVLGGVALLALAFIAVSSAYSLANWFAPYRDNQFNKADFRITSGVVRERIGPDETVLLSSGHMFPAWAYYYGWRGWHPLPAIEVLDVNAALDMSVGDQMDALLQGNRGAWLVRWQSGTTDPFDVLPLLLGTGGVEDVRTAFWHMELRHYRLPPAARYDLDTFVTTPLGMTFGGQLRLLGMRVMPPPPALDSSDPAATSGDGTDVVFVWQAITPVRADYTVFVHLLDGAGGVVTTADHLPARPTHEWQAGRILPDRARLMLSPGVPDGVYQLEIGLYDAAQPDMPRLGPVQREDSGELQPGERVLVPVVIAGGRLE